MPPPSASWLAVSSGAASTRSQLRYLAGKRFISDQYLCCQARLGLGGWGSRSATISLIDWLSGHTWASLVRCRRISHPICIGLSSHRTLTSWLSISPCTAPGGVSMAPAAWAGKSRPQAPAHWRTTPTSPSLAASWSSSTWRSCTLPCRSYWLWVPPVTSMPTSATIYRLCDSRPVSYCSWLLSVIEDNWQTHYKTAIHELKHK